MVRKSRLIASLVVVLGAAAFVGTPANSQSPDQLKIIVYSVGFDGPGLLNSSVNMQLRRGNTNQLSFSIVIPHVQSIDEAIAKVKPEIEKLADELKTAPVEKQP